MKKEIKPPKFKHFLRGSKLGNALLTRIRVGRSFLNQHSFTIGIADSPECDCQSVIIKISHLNFVDCFLYSPEHQTLFSLLNTKLQTLIDYPKRRNYI